MTTITKTQLENASADVELISDVANGGPTESFTSRLGQPVDSVAKSVATLSAYNPRGAWITSTSYALKDIVIQTSIAYICTIAHISGVFATDLAAGKWTVHQGATYERLDDPDGATLIGATGGTVQQVLTALAAHDAVIDAEIAAGLIAPVNFAPNSQWEVMAGLSYGTRWNVNGTGTLGTLAMASNTFGSADSNNTCVLTYTGTPTQWEAGHLIKLSGGSVPSPLADFPMRITAMDATTITVKLPRGGKAASSGTGTIQNINIGGSVSSGTGDAADGWKKHVSTLVWREDNAVNIAHGAIYTLGCNKQTTGEEYVYTELEPKRWLGRTVTIGMWVYQKVRGASGTWKLFFNSDGTGGTVSESSAASTTAGWQWMEWSYAVPVDATYIQAGIKLNGALNDTYYLGNPVVAAGSRIGQGNYVKPKETFLPIVKVEPAAWINASITFPTLNTAGGSSGGLYLWPIDLHADTGGQLAKTVKCVLGNIEGINANAVVTGIGGSRVIGFTTPLPDPIRLGTFMPQYVTNVKSFAPLRLMTTDGIGGVFSGVTVDSWSNISIDIDVIFLD